MNEELTPRDQIVRLMDGYLDTQLVYVAARLSIADLLRDGPRSSGELAGLTGTSPSALHRLLRGLVVVGVLDEDPGVASSSRPPDTTWSRTPWIRCAAP